MFEKDQYGDIPMQIYPRDLAARRLRSWINGFIIGAIAMLIFCMLTVKVAGAQTIIHQTIPGTTVRDYSAPSLVIQPNGTGYQTIPGTTARDYSAPGFTIQRGNDNAGIIWNQHRAYQPMQQNLFRLWPPQD